MIEAAEFAVRLSFMEEACQAIQSVAVTQSGPPRELPVEPNQRRLSSRAVRDELPSFPGHPRPGVDTADAMASKDCPEDSSAALRAAVERLGEPFIPLPRPRPRTETDIFAPSREVARLVRAVLHREATAAQLSAAVRRLAELLDEMQGTFGVLQPRARPSLERALSPDARAGEPPLLDDDDSRPQPYRVLLGAIEELFEPDRERAETIARALEGYATARTCLDWSRAHPREDAEEIALGVQTESEVDRARKQKLFEQQATSTLARLNHPDWRGAHRESWRLALAALEARPE